VDGRLRLRNLGQGNLCIFLFEAAKWKSVTTDDFLCLFWGGKRNKIFEVKVAGKQGM